jgi:hypothetical protein
MVRKAGGAAVLAVALGLLALLQGCAAVQDTADFATSVFEPGVPGRKPLTASQAAQLSDAQVNQRLDFVTRSLDDNRLHAALWQYGFLALNAGGMIAGATTAAFEENEDDKIYNILNASLGLFGVVYMVADPLPGRSGADPVYLMPFDSAADRAAQLAEGERILYAAAGRATQRTGWILHTGNIVLNASAASVLLARESYGDAALLFFVNSAVGTAQILLTPWAPLTEWEEYQALVANGGVPPEPTVRWGIGPMPDAPGLALHVSY